MAWKFWSKAPRPAKPPLHTQIKQYYSRLTTSSKHDSPSTMEQHGSKDASPRGSPCVVMPLYIYPLPDKDPWKPLYDAISTHPTIPFLIIINPNSGPGDSPLPGADYIREIPKINAFPNVRTVGYIAITWGRKSLDDVQAEIRRYAEWETKHQIEGLYLEGIYFDETPNHVTEHGRGYLENLTGFVKGCEGLCGERLVIHNPGTPPEGPLSAFGNPDIVCVCEEPHNRYVTAELQGRMNTYALPYDKTLYQISGVPMGEIERTTREMMERRARYVFVTDLGEDFYESFGESWGGFLRAVGEGCVITGGEGVTGRGEGNGCGNESK